MPKTRKDAELVTQSHTGFDPWVAGYEDAKLGIESTNNPFDVEDTRHHTWLEGWNNYKREVTSRHYHNDSDDFDKFDDEL